MSGPRAAPGTYTVRLTADDWTASESVEVLKDPRLFDVTVAHLQEQFEFLMDVSDAFERLNEATSLIRGLRAEVDSVMGPLGDRAGREIEQAADRVRVGLLEVEGALIQTRPGGWANEPRIRGHLSWVATAASSQRGISYDARPTDQLWERYSDLDTELAVKIELLERLVEIEMRQLREMLRGITE